MMKGCPPIGVHVVYVCLALNNGLKCHTLKALFQLREDCLVNWGFTEDAQFVIDLISTVDQVLEVFNVCLVGSVVKVLEHTSHELVLAHLKRPFRESRRVGISAKLYHVTGGLEVAEV